MAANGVNDRMDAEKVTLQAGDGRGKGKAHLRIVCPYCGNDSDFMEVADSVILTTRYVQNEDSSFTQVDDESEILGEIRFFCGECNADLSQYHKRFLEMLF